MPTSPPRRSPRRGVACLSCSGVLGLALLGASGAFAQDASSASAATPAGTDTPAVTVSIAPAAPAPTVSHRRAHEAEAAYLEGAKAVDRRDFATAEKSFARAIQLNPANREYALALIVTREHAVTALVQDAAKARLLGNTARAEELLTQARALDPDSPVIEQHFSALAPIETTPPPHNVNASLGGEIELAPTTGVKDVHLRGSAQDLLRSLYSLYGLRASIDPSVTLSVPVRLDLDSATFADAARVAGSVTHTFAVPLDAHSALIADDTEENRDKLQPQLEETVFMPGLPAEQMTDMANLARNVFDLKSVTASTASGSLVLRGDPQTLKVLNATYSNMLGGSSDVLLDVNLYEVDRTNTRNIGLQLPSTAGIFSVTAQAAQIVAANQSVVNQAIASGLIKLTGNSLTDLITEVGFLIASGTVSVAQYTNLLGIFGNGLSLAGLYIGSGATFHLLLNSSDVRTLDAVKLRAGDREPANFRAGSRYPIETGVYSSGLSNSLASSVAGLNINGTSVSSLLQQYLGSASTTVPQIQFEDLGLTLKATPQILHGGSVQLALEMKIESLGGTKLNGIPVLNERQLTSTVVIPAGQTALLVSQLSTSESRAVQGVPGLSDLPGFQGTTNHSTEKDSGELLITITPHLVREGYLHIASRPLMLPHSEGTGAGGPPQPPINPPQPQPEPPAPGSPGGPPAPAPATPLQPSAPPTTTIRQPS